MYWALDLYAKGFEFDCILNGYGALTDPNSISFPDLTNSTSDDFFDKGISELNKRNLSAAIIYFGIAIQLNPDSEKCYQARGYCKDELFTWKAARDDYDKALSIDPTYVDALILRATNKDDAGEHSEALTDYDKVIELEPDNDLAFYNRGNTKFSLGDKDGACKDWTKAKELGSAYAQERLDLECT
jgi:tetratricopeptide (TPR) repeat protein